MLSASVQVTAISLTLPWVPHWQTQSRHFPPPGQMAVNNGPCSAVSEWQFLSIVWPLCGIPGRPHKHAHTCLFHFCKGRPPAPRTIDLWRWVTPERARRQCNDWGSGTARGGPAGYFVVFLPSHRLNRCCFFPTELPGLSGAFLRVVSKSKRTFKNASAPRGRNTRSLECARPSPR